MALLEPTTVERLHGGRRDAPAGPGERETRWALGVEIARLERELGDVQVASFPHGAPIGCAASTGGRGPRLLGIGELTALRDALSEHLCDARLQLEALGREQEGHRVRLERMLLAPGKHRFETVSNKQLGEGGCGVWQVRPRLGVIGMLAGWWHVKLSSGCPLATARRAAPG